MIDKNYFAYQYVDSDYEDPKEIFKFIADIIEKNLYSKKSMSILDIGCAKGEFLYYIKSRFSSYSPYMFGIDISEALIKLFRELPALSGVDSEVTSFEDFRTERKFDFITATGIISLFDDYVMCLEKMFEHLDHEGVIILTNGFSTSNLDVLVRYRDYLKDDEWLPGWNQHSISGIEKYVNQKGKKLAAHKFIFPRKLPRGKDPLRSYTLETSEGQKFVNDLNLIWNLWGLEIK